LLFVQSRCYLAFEVSCAVFQGIHLSSEHTDFVEKLRIFLFHFFDVRIQRNYFYVFFDKLFFGMISRVVDWKKLFMVRVILFVTFIKLLLKH
jgi:hypothetical protein